MGGKQRFELRAHLRVPGIGEGRDEADRHEAVDHHVLRRAGVLNVEVRVADGASADLSADGPFDAILLSGSVAQLPEALLAMLKPGGRLMGIVGDDPIMRATLVYQSPAGAVVTQPWDENVPRLLNFPEPSRFRF